MVLERKKTVMLRFTEAEWADLENKIQSTGKRPAVYCRDAVLGKEIRSLPPTDLLDVRSQLGRIGNNLNQISYQLNSRQEVWDKFLLKNIVVYLKCLQSSVTELNLKYLELVAAQCNKRD